MADEFDVDVDALVADEEEAPAEEAAPATPEAETPREARAMSARKPGPLKVLADKATAPFARVRLPVWNLLTFLRLLLVLLLLWLLLENWAPTRVHLLVWNVESPKTLLFLVNLALGAALLRWWQVYGAQRAARKAAQAAAAEAPAEEPGAPPAA